MLRLLSLIAVAALLADQAPAPRRIVVIGDLHMGEGRSDAGWHPYEDFRWRDEFIAFLNSLDSSAAATDLIINGDLFELLQSSTVPCAAASPGLGCSVDEALNRLRRATTAHAAELAAIGKFAQAGANRVYVIPGEHDAALLSPVLWQHALSAFGAPGDRIVLAASGHWQSADSRVHVEHGHQLPLSADRFTKWPVPFVAANGRMHIERPWGEAALMPFYDRTEARYPIVDNVAEEGNGVKFVAAAMAGDAAADAAPLLRVLLTRTTWQQFRMDLDDGEVQAPAWDVARIRKDVPAFMLSSLPVDDPFAPVAKQLSPAALAEIGAALTDEQIVAVCDYRAAIRRARRRMERVLTQLAGAGAPIAECPRLADTIGPAFEYYWRSRDAQVRAHLPGGQTRDAVIFGHTHLLDRAFRPWGDEGPVVVTSGAWQRTIHPNDITAIDAPVESLPACYSFVDIPAVSGKRTPETRSWRLNDQQQWVMRPGGC